MFHLAAVVSGQAEAEFDVGMRVNLDATRALLERCRRLAAPPKFVFASSLAVFGGPLPDPVPDDAPLTPQASYGTQKAIGEYLVYDMTRKGFLDGRSLRLPTVTVRPGKPNKAASSFASGIIREPLVGRRRGLPRRDDDEDVGDLAARGDRQPHHRPRSAGGGVRAHALGQRARASRSRSATWSRRCDASRATPSPIASSGSSIRRSTGSCRRGRRTSRRSSVARWG